MRYADLGIGKVWSWTIVREPPHGFEKFAPYAIALIKLANNKLITAQLTDIDLDTIEIGMEVECVTRKLKENGNKGTIVYGYKFRPKILTSD